MSLPNQLGNLPQARAGVGIRDNEGTMRISSKQNIIKTEMQMVANRGERFSFTVLFAYFCDVRDAEWFTGTPKSWIAALVHPLASGWVHTDIRQMEGMQVRLPTSRRPNLQQLSSRPRCSTGATSLLWAPALPAFFTVPAMAWTKQRARARTAWHISVKGRRSYHSLTLGSVW